MLVFFPFWALDANGQNLSLEQYRKLRDEAYNKQQAAKEFYQNTRQFNEKSAPLMIGFKAIAEMMMCNHLLNPMGKLAYFKSGKRNLEMAITAEPSNVELRFMRFCTQVNTPALLGYKNNVKKDKQFLIQYLNNQKYESRREDESLYQSIKKFLLSSNECDASEKQLVQNL